MRRGLALVSCWLAVACASAPRGSGEHVELVYGWKPGFACGVAVEGSSLQQAGDTKTESTIRGSFRLSADAAGDKLLVRTSDLQLSIDDARMAGAQLIDLTAQLASLPANILVDPAGRFAGIDELPAFQARISEMFRKMVPSGALPAEFLTRVQDRFLSGDMLLAGAADHWNGMVGAWLAARLEVGAAPVAIDQHVPHPLIPGEQLLVHTEFDATGLTPCTRGSLALTCVELEIRTVSDRDDSTRIVQKFAGELLETVKPSMGQMEITEVSIEKAVHLVTEPDGLFPHRYVKTETVTSVLALNGKPIPVRREKRLDYSFAY